MTQLITRLRAAQNTTLGVGALWNLCDEAADDIEYLLYENTRLLRLMVKAHTVMRQTGWQLAPASADAEDDGVLELAAAEIEGEFADVLSAGQLEARE